MRYLVLNCKEAFDMALIWKAVLYLKEKIYNKFWSKRYFNNSLSIPFYILAKFYFDKQEYNKIFRKPKSIQYYKIQFGVE